jgi:hypothetical protein
VACFGWPVSDQPKNATSFVKKKKKCMQKLASLKRNLAVLPLMTQKIVLAIETLSAMRTSKSCLNISQ